MSKRIISLFLFASIFLLGSCNNEPTSDPSKRVGLDTDAQKALEVFNNYCAALKNSLSRSQEEATILNVVEMDIPVKANDTGTNPLSRTTNTGHLKLHRITFALADQEGFAIVSADGRVRSNFMYCEKGSIEDTAYIEPVAEYIREIIPQLCEDDLQAYYSGQTDVEEITLSRATQPTIYLDMKTKWGQGSPYNKKLAMINCNGLPTRPYVGCTGLAIAQTLVYLLPDGYNLYPINKMKEVVSCKYSLGEEYADDIAEFIRAVSASYMEYTCSGSGAWLSDSKTELRNWGFIEGSGYIHKSTNSLDKGKFYASLQAHCPTLMSGSNGKGNAHTWILHGQRYNGNTREIYCNYGWDGSCDGWYSDWQRPITSTGEPKISGSYYRNNKYMYFLENRSTPTIY